MSSLKKYLVLRVLRFALTLYAVITVTFLLFRIAPGSPLTAFVTGSFTEEAEQRMLELYGLNEPLYIQYIRYIENMLTGNFGISFVRQEPVLNILFPRLINTLILTVPAMIMVLLTAYYFGTFLGWYRGTLIEEIGSSIVITFRSIPHFVLGLTLLTIFSYWLGWLPIGGMGSLTEYANQSLVEQLTTVTFYKHYLLPFLTIYLYYLTSPTLLQRSNVISHMQEESVRFLELKGLSNPRIRQHAAKNSMLPLVTWGSTLISIMFGGVILIEVVFSWPGIGELLITAVHDRDYPLVQGAFFIIAFMVLFANMVIDFLYAHLDPRIEYGGDA